MSRTAYHVEHHRTVGLAGCRKSSAVEPLAARGILRIEASASQIRCTQAQPSFYGEAGPVVFCFFPVADCALRRPAVNGMVRGPARRTNELAFQYPCRQVNLREAHDLSSSTSWTDSPQFLAQRGTLCVPRRGQARVLYPRASGGLRLRRA